MNKLAAGALALALGLGAVAPAVAAEGHTGKSFISEAYNQKIKEVEELYVKKEADRKELEDAKKAVEAADALVKSTKKAYDDAAKASSSEVLPATIEAAKNAVNTAKSELELAAKKLNSLVDENKKANAQGEPEGDKLEGDALKTAIDEAQAEYNKKELAYGAAQDAYAKKVADVKAGEKEVNLSPKAKAFRAYSEALDNQKKAIARKVKADRKYNGEIDQTTGEYTKEAEGSREKYDQELDKLVKWAEGAGAILNIEGGKITVKPAEKEVKKDNLAELKRAKSDAETAIKAVKLLKELSPEKIKKVEAKLNALVAKNEELVKKADAQIAKLEKKMAFISTAYAAEEDDTDALIKELDQTTGEIKDLIKDTPEDKKANEEKKPEEKKPEEKTPSKKAGNNAKTGIAGIAGVAGILAAASVAYAASKRD